MKSFVAKFVLQLLLPEQEEHCAAVANDLTQTTTNEPAFLKKFSWMQLWPGNKGPVVPMEVTWFSTPKEGTAKSQQDQDHISCVFFIGKVLSITNTLLQAKQLIRSTTSMFFVGWEMQRDKNSHSEGQQAIGSVIMTTMMHALSHACAEFFGKTSNLQGDSAPLQPRFGSLWLLAFPKTKITFEREEILDHWWNSGKYKGGNWWKLPQRILQCFE